MKKLTLYLLLFALLFSLVACGGGGGGTETTTDTESESVITPTDPDSDLFSGGTEVESIIAMDQSGTKNEITRHTTISEIVQLFPDYLSAEHPLLMDYGVAVFTSEQGAMVLLDYENEKLYLYPENAEITAEELDQIKIGMTTLEMFLLIRRVPVFTFTASQTFYYKSSDGMRYHEFQTGVDFNKPQEERTTIIERTYIYYLKYSAEPLLPSAQISASELTAGMTREALGTLLTQEKHIDWDGYVLFRDQDDQSVIVTLDKNDVVTEVTVYAPLAEIPQKADVMALENATIFDYVEVCGLPFLTELWSKGECLNVMTQNGSYVIGMSYNDETFELY